MSKEDLIKKIKNYKISGERNSMGCMEDWYNYVFAFKETFSIEEIENMSQKEIDNLIKLASNIQDGLY